MQRLQIATLAMSAAAAVVVAVLAAFGHMTAAVVTDQIGELAVAYNNATLERDFEKIYPQYRSRLPIRIDGRTTLIDLPYRGHVFRLRHLVETDNGKAPAVAALTERARKAMVTKACADEDMGATMKRGAIYEYRYLDRQSRLVGGFDIRNADCDPDLESAIRRG